VHLNPGHFIHLDEWPGSPVYAGSDVALTSGMTLQLDIIPATGTVYHTTNIEDGIALAGEPTRAGQFSTPVRAPLPASVTLITPATCVRSRGCPASAAHLRPPVLMNAAVCDDASPRQRPSGRFDRLCYGREQGRR
jgi:hypothetical protein